MAILVFEINPDTVVHENNNYAVDVGPYPGEPLNCYRIYNKNTGVLEYAHTIIFYACQWADEADKVLTNGNAGPIEADFPGVQGEPGEA